jgi:putative ABC transport system substrate-binding protein
MDRRKSLVAALGVLAVSLHGHGQQAGRIYRIGVLGGGDGARWQGFRDQLRELGWIAGSNVEILWRWSEGATERIAAHAAELVRLKVDVIVTEGSLQAKVAKNATSTIPIVIASSGDPVGAGLVESLARPGGNVTGSATTSPHLIEKGLEFLRDAVPGLERIAVLWNSANPVHAVGLKQVHATAAVLRLRVRAVSAQTPQQMAAAFAEIAASDAQAMTMLADVVFDANQREAAAFAMKSGLPAIYNKSEFVKAGGLMSYGPRFDEFFRHAATYVDRILKGASPADLPVEQPTKFELAINLKTAKALRLTIPRALLLRAEEVVE